MVKEENSRNSHTRPTLTVDDKVVGASRWKLSGFCWLIMRGVNKRTQPLHPPLPVTHSLPLPYPPTGPHPVCLRSLMLTLSSTWCTMVHWTTLSWAYVYRYHAEWCFFFFFFLHKEHFYINVFYVMLEALGFKQFCQYWCWKDTVRCFKQCFLNV